MRHILGFIFSGNTSDEHAVVLSKQWVEPVKYNHIFVQRSKIPRVKRKVIRKIASSTSSQFVPFKYESYAL